MVDCQRAKLVRIMHRLEGEVIVLMTSSYAIHIPAGCIHATFTLQGGFLVAKDFTTSNSLTAIASYLLHGLDQALSSTARDVCYGWFERCLDVCLTSGKLDIVLEAWVRSQEQGANHQATIIKQSFDRRRADDARRKFSFKTHIQPPLDSIHEPAAASNRTARGLSIDIMVL
ncbi:hypothetical protein V1524DRAFT_419248 [Lipomyces starkeyi]